MYLFKYYFLFKRKALKKFKPLSVDVAESEDLKAILNEIVVMQKLTSKSEYVINYLDTFSTLVDNDEYKVYHIVTNIYEVKYSNIIS
jgi:hypothetical protein